MASDGVPTTYKRETMCSDYSRLRFSSHCPLTGLGVALSWESVLFPRFESWAREAQKFRWTLIVLFLCFLGGGVVGVCAPGFDRQSCKNI